MLTEDFLPTKIKKTSVKVKKNKAPNIVTPLASGTKKAPKIVIPI